MSRVVWEGVFTNFGEGPAVGQGFSGPEWVQRSRQRALDMIERSRGGSSIKSLPNHHTGWLVGLAGLIGAQSQRVNILDFGGGLGFSYLPVATALPAACSLSYVVVETPPVCEEGEDLFSDDPRIRFSASVPEESDWDILHLGSTLHYIEDWQGLLTRLLGLGPRYVSLVDLPAGDIPTFASRQRYYGSLIPCWFFNLPEIKAQMGRLGFALAAQAPHHALIWGENTFPVANLPEGLRLPHTCDLLFVRGAR